MYQLKQGTMDSSLSAIASKLSEGHHCTMISGDWCITFSRHAQIAVLRTKTHHKHSTCNAVVQLKPGLPDHVQVHHDSPKDVSATGLRHPAVEVEAETTVMRHQGLGDRPWLQ